MVRGEKTNVQHFYNLLGLLISDIFFVCSHSEVRRLPRVFVVANWLHISGVALRRHDR